MVFRRAQATADLGRKLSLLGGSLTAVKMARVRHVHWGRHTAKLRGTLVLEVVSVCSAANSLVFGRKSASGLSVFCRT